MYPPGLSVPARIVAQSDHDPEFISASQVAGAVRVWKLALRAVLAAWVAKAVAGTPRNSVYVLDDRDGGHRPEMIVTDTSSYSDIVFGLLALAGYVYATQPADLPDQKMRRVNPRADSGPFNDAVRSRIDLKRLTM
jgi:TnpA family transposase